MIDIEIIYKLSNVLNNGFMIKKFDNNILLLLFMKLNLN